MSNDTRTDDATDAPVKAAYMSRADVLALFPVAMTAQKLSWLVRAHGFPEPVTLSRDDVWFPSDAVRAWIDSKFAMMPTPVFTQSHGPARGKYGKA